MASPRSRRATIRASPWNSRAGSSYSRYGAARISACAAAGLRAYSHIGATFVTSWHNYDYYRHDVINYVPRTMRPDMVSQWPPTELAEGYYWEAVRENYTLEDQGRVMHVYYANPLQHAEGMLVAYLPKEKLLLENDIVNTNNLPTM